MPSSFLLTSLIFIVSYKNEDGLLLSGNKIKQLVRKKEQLAGKTKQLPRETEQAQGKTKQPQRKTEQASYDVIMI